MIKYTLNVKMERSEFIDDLLKNDYASWSYNGAEALYEYLENFEEDTGQQIKFDRVSLSEYSEHDSLGDVLSHCTIKDVPALYRQLSRLDGKIEFTKEDSDTKRARENKREYKKLFKATLEIIDVLEKHQEEDNND